MDLTNLKPKAGSIRKNKRLGRGQASGTGGSASRGTKGDKSRSGFKYKRGFEGGQMPLQRRIPKFGFNNIHRVEYKAINLDTLVQLSEKINKKEITLSDIKSHGLIGKNDKVKILARGELSKALKIEAHAFSKKAQQIIESQGGSITIVK